VSGALVSVVMPVRDGGSYVGAAIASIVGQPVDDLELIVVDDGSSRESLEVVDRWMEADPRIRIVRGAKGRGPGAAFDRGVAASSGSLLARMDADDVALPWRLPLQLSFLLAHPEVVMVGGLIELMDANGGLLGLERVPLGDAAIREQLPNHCFFNPTLVVRRAVHERVGGHRPVYGAADDVDFALRVAEAGAVANLDVPLVRYRVHGDSVSDRGLARQAIAALLAQESYRRRARGRPDPAVGASKLEELLAATGLDPVEVAAAVERAVVGRAALLGRAGLSGVGRTLASRSDDTWAGVPPPDRRAVRRAARQGSAWRLADDLRGARVTEQGASWLLLALATRRAVSRAGIVLDRGADVVRRVLSRRDSGAASG
jgi:hypothetical protein